MQPRAGGSLCRQGKVRAHEVEVVVVVEEEEEEEEEVESSVLLFSPLLASEAARLLEMSSSASENDLTRDSFSSLPASPPVSSVV